MNRNESLKTLDNLYSPFSDIPANKNIGIKFMLEVIEEMGQGAFTDEALYAMAEKVTKYEEQNIKNMQNVSDFGFDFSWE